MQIIQALYESIDIGSFVKLDLPNRTQRPTPAQTIEVPCLHQSPKLINATHPSGKSQ